MAIVSPNYINKICIVLGGFPFYLTKFPNQSLKLSEDFEINNIFE